MMLTIFRRLLTISICFLFLSSIFFVHSQIVSADRNFEIQLYNRVDISWDIKETKKPIVPRDELKILNLSIFYTVDTGNYLAKGLYDFWQNPLNFKNNRSVVNIRLHIVDSSPWCSVALESNIVYVNFSKNQTTSAPLYLILNEDAPAYGSGYIKIKAAIPKITGTPIKSFDTNFNLSFIPTYFPYIDINLSKGNTMEISPLQQAEFPVIVENLGNARTKVFFDVINPPEEWTIVVDDEIILDEEIGSNNNATLSVQPPKNFGYYDETKIIQIAVTPARAENISERGDAIYATFIVKTKGFATTGLNLGFFLIALILIISILVFKRYKKND